MLTKIMSLTSVATLSLLLMPSEVDAWGAAHVGVTRVGPGGVYHAGRTVAAGPGGVYSSGRAVGVGAAGGVYGGGYRAGVGYGGASSGAYRYGGVGYGGVSGGYRYSAGYAGG